jgi:hypothetical protein
MAIITAAAKKAAPRKREPTQAQIDAAEGRAIVAITKLLQYVCKQRNLDHALIAVRELQGINALGVKAMYMPRSQIPSEGVQRHQTALKVAAKANAIRAEKGRNW